MRTAHHSRRDRAADLGLFLLAAFVAVLSTRAVPAGEEYAGTWRTADQLLGALGCAAVFLRRRWPVRLAVVLLLGGGVAHYLTGPALVAVFTVAASRPWRVTAWVTALAFAPLPVFLWRLPELAEDRAGSAVTYFVLIAGAVGWGLFRRSRQQLITSLRERAELAEADAALRAERAQQTAREEIAREMHDVLGHRLSLLSLHAGALEFNPGAPRAEIERAAGVIRESAHLALQDLREVIGVLRAPPGEFGDRPQPGLGDVAGLVAESRQAGMRIEFDGQPEPTGAAEDGGEGDGGTGDGGAPDRGVPDRGVPDRGVADNRAADGGARAAPEPPPVVGRAAYRIVQEALTNARRHAPGAPVRLTVSGGPGDGLTVRVSNPLRGGVSGGASFAAAGAASDGASGPSTAAAGTAPAGGGQGLVGLAERARLTGGRCAHGTADGEFVISAWLPWESPEPGL
ncbi:histidine kinase [Streptomyces sp. NPDC089799]|uniref:sensor histidine kinase n=1 Tax=Streptomyces sp. NPDC089799 TaxID=3155066 RepID=UPI0034163066